MADFYSGWLSPPNGGARYRLHYIVNVASQDVAANKTTLNWSMSLQKDRSQNGFFGYTATFSASINGVGVWDQTTVNPSQAWTGWASIALATGAYTVTHNADGTKTVPVTATYAGANSGWAIGTVTTVGNLNLVLPAIPRATRPTVTPSPAVINTDVVIDLLRADATFTHDLTWESGILSGVIANGVGVQALWTVPDVFNTPTAAKPSSRTNIARLPGATSGWNTRWFGGSGAAGTYTYPSGSGIPDGPDTYVRKTWTSAPLGASGDTGISVTNGTDGNVILGIVAGQVYTISGWMRTSGTGRSGSVVVVWYDSANAAIGSAVGSTAVPLTSSWQRLALIGATAPVGAVKIAVIFENDIGGAWPTGSTLDASGLLLEQTATLLPYFSGTTLDTTAYDYAWSGTANDSTSTAALKTQFQTGLDSDGAPIAITATTKSGATVLGTKQVTLLSLETAPPVNLVPAPPAVNPAKQFDVRARLVRYTTDAFVDWSAREVLPANTITMVDPHSATTTCTIGLSKLSPISTRFEDFSVVDIDIFNGTSWKFTNHRFVLSRREGDDLDPSRVTNYSGTEYMDYMLGFAYFQEDYRWDGSEGRATTTETPGTKPGMRPTTPGEMMRGVIQDAQARGWGPRIGFTFNDVKTSLGEPWANKDINRVFNKGTPGSQVLQSLVDDGLVEYRTEYRDNKAWLILLNPGTGSDYSAKLATKVVNFRLANLSRAPRRSTMEGQITAVTVVGDEEIQSTRTKAPFDANVFGRMEGWVSASGLKSLGAADTIGDILLRTNSNPSHERTFEYDAQSVAPQFYPYSVFRPGDWVLIPDGDNNITDRISQVTINKGADGTSLTVLTGDRIMSGTAGLAKRVSAQAGGSISAGSGRAPSTVDSRVPAAPVIGNITSLGYWNSDGAARSAVTLTWSAVRSALSGESLSVNLYEVWWRPSGIGAEWSLRGSTTDLTIELGDWDVLASLDFRVRARSTGNIFGDFSINSDGNITLAPAVDLSGPIITDLYTDGVGSIFIVWAGILGTTAAPKRMAYVTGEISTNGGTTYTTAGTPITAAGTIIINPKAWGDFTVRIRPYDRLGNPGTSSASQLITLEDPRLNPVVSPVAPTALAAVAGAGWGASGFFPEAWFDLTWTAPTLDEKGMAVEIAGYDVLGIGAGETIERVVASTTVGTVGARVKVGGGETWTFRVRAASTLGGLSLPSNAVTVTANAAIAAAVAPTAPTLDQYAGLLRIKWGGGGMVPQIKYAYAAISSTVDGIYTRAGVPLNGAGEIVVPGLAPGPYFAKIILVDELGTLSASAASDSITLLPITGVTIQTSELANTGIKLTSGSLTSYDVSGNPTFILSAATGEVWIAPYDAVFNLGASGTIATTGAPTTGVAISSQNSSFNTFIHPSGVEIRNDQTPLSWWEADEADASLVNFFSPRAVIGQRMRVGDFEMLREAKTTGSRLVIRYKGD